MTISMKRRKPFHPSLIFDIVYLKEVESHKHLGIAICNNLSWNPHVKEIIFKAYAKLGQMRKCKYKRILDRDSLQTLFSHIIPAIEYADIICDHILENLSLKIENIQQKAARIVTGDINKHHKTCYILKRVGFHCIKEEKIIILSNYLRSIIIKHIIIKHRNTYTDSCKRYYSKSNKYT